MKPLKSSQVFSKQMAKLDQRINQFSDALLVLTVVTLLYHPLWLILITGACWTLSCLLIIIQFVLEIRNSRKLANRKKHQS